ncbi:MAG: hypothetical protein ABWZ85_07860 [Luteibacter sp.]
MSDPSMLPEDNAAISLPDGFVPGTVAPFVMRYGTDFLVAMQRAALMHDAEQPSAEAEPA